MCRFQGAHILQEGWTFAPDPMVAPNIRSSIRRQAWHGLGDTRKSSNHVIAQAARAKRFANEWGLGAQLTSTRSVVSVDSIGQVMVCMGIVLVQPHKIRLVGAMQNPLIDPQHLFSDVRPGVILRDQCSSFVSHLRAPHRVGAEKIR